MTAIIGNLALIFATLISCYQFLNLRNINKKRFLNPDRAITLQFFFILVAFFTLMFAYVVSDFSLLNVYQNSHSAKPLLYKITGVWGNHEGSMLLWVLVLVFFGFLISKFDKRLDLQYKTLTLSFQSLITFIFLLFILLTSNPFIIILPVPINGEDLNPLLQDPGLAFHPPTLYIGYVGLSIVFSFTLARFYKGNFDSRWAKLIKPWVLLSWSFLTLGISLGSWWAYYELGWGGFWFWDPVENASLMPWLCATALLHSTLVLEKRNALKKWTILLAFLSFSFSLIGTFLVRSGIITSVHAFATDPTRGVFILIICAFFIFSSLILLTKKANSIKEEKLVTPISKEGTIVFNNLLMIALLLTIFIGTIYPIFLEIFTGEQISVGPPYFNLTTTLIMAPAIIVMSFAPILNWKKDDLLGLISRLKIILFLSLLVTLISFYIKYQGPIIALVGIFLSAWLFFGTLINFLERTNYLKKIKFLNNQYLGMIIAHFGVAIFIAGVTGSTLWKIEKIETLKVGEKILLNNYSLNFDKIKKIRGKNYIGHEAEFNLYKKNKFIKTLKPQKRFYPVQEFPTTEAAIYSRGLSDIYIAMSEPVEDSWLFRFHYSPLTPWIWIGSIMAFIGGIFSFSHRMFRRK
ncbi:MAG: heme lyase NrfEFG subunit NrfE [Pelagibacteraceae bacterium]|nr:heme lyase NrfEFG subunit NrfE [Pelagibacteraceae bacterium]|tara:strand:- start:853 stop:2751 length:1899 start_codon:yes stop_codon:yes gene_type:complete